VGGGFPLFSALSNTSAPSTWCASRVERLPHPVGEESHARHTSGGEHQSQGEHPQLARAPVASSILEARRSITPGPAVDAAATRRISSRSGRPIASSWVTSSSVVRGLRVQLEHQVDHSGAGRGVEIAGGLVGEQQLRPRDEGAGERHALLLAPERVFG